MPGPKPTPVTIRGVTYASPKEAAQALGVSHHTVKAARMRGKLDFVGLGLRAAQPVTIRGVTYASPKEAAQALGVSHHTVKTARRRGTLDFVGCGHRVGKSWKARGEYAPASKPILIQGVEYPSRKIAAEVFGVSVNTILRREKRGTLSRLKAPKGCIPLTYGRPIPTCTV